MSPQSPRPLLPRLCRRERGTGKARRVEQQEPRLGPGDHSPGRRSRRAFAQEAPAARLERALLCRRRLGVRPGPPLSCAHCTPGRGRPWGKPPSHPRGRRHRPLALGWWLFPKSSGHASACLSQEVPELSTRIATLSTGTLLTACDCLPWGVFNLFPKPIQVTLLEKVQKKKTKFICDPTIRTLQLL